MYQKELDSLMKQTIPPSQIIVYIAEGYPIPKETVGVEKYVYVPKGMIAQRALPYDEIDSDYVLLLDDDCYLAPSSVETLYSSMQNAGGGDCIAVDAFQDHKMSKFAKIRTLLSSSVSPRKDDNWAFKIRCSGASSYNNAPSRSLYLTQSAAGLCALWKLESLRNIHFEDELWMDQFSYPAGEDQIMFNKAYKNGARIWLHYDAGVTHLDAGVSRKNTSYHLTKRRDSAALQFIIWYRSCYNIPSSNILSKLLSICAYSLRFLISTNAQLIFSVCKFDFSLIVGYLSGNIRGLRYILSNRYKDIPPFIISK